MNVHMHPMFPARGTLHEQEAFALKYMDRMARIRATNEEAKRVKDQVRTRRVTEPVHVHVASVCQAVNMSGAPCKFKATCGRFCKKHKVTAKDLELFDE